MKVILIIVTLNSAAAVTAIEFDDARACEAAALALKRLTEVRTACVPKAGK